MLFIFGIGRLRGGYVVGLVLLGVSWCAGRRSRCRSRRELMCVGRGSVFVLVRLVRCVRFFRC